jgi:hypothetical protein
MKTAEEFLEKNNLPETLSGGTLKWAMIEFAKLHVEAALKAAVDNVEMYDFDSHGEYCPDIDDESILNSYPLENIK